MKLKLKLNIWNAKNYTETETAACRAGGTVTA